ncbi:MAG TPA: DUF429 domain-containing protein [Longimicrobiaceae bacterium]|nr:DUF429 domain-containing protein [Longimicrobiaceae bacterium]
MNPLPCSLMFDYFGGIDFSGAKEPLSNLWSAVGRERDGKLQVVSLCPHAFRQDLAHHVSGGWRKPVEAGEDAPILWGADFPFGLPADAAAALTGGPAGWEATAAWVADRPADEVRSALPEHHKAPRRTDTGGAMAPLDLRLYRQTVEGIRWLHELREADEVSILPQAPHPRARTTLIEVYPSGTVTDLGIRCKRAPSRPGEVRARPAALRPYLTFADPGLEAVAVTLEDAWDAVIACLTAYLARHDLEQPFRIHPTERGTIEREGWIYRAPAALE